MKAGSIAPASLPLFAAALALAAGGDAAAQAEARGRALARSWCASCHLVEPGLRGTDAAPSFVAIANDPDYTRRRIETWLVDPHPPMPKLQLSRPEIESITDYILSLKGKP
jgi:mono/diheme cytochrome c family protein